MSWEPRFRITSEIAKNIVEITEIITKKDLGNFGNDSPQLRRINRLRSLHSSLAIEGNRLSIEEITSIIDGKMVVGPEREILEVKNANEAYNEIDSVDPFSIGDLLKIHGIMMKGLVDNAGSFRTEGEMVIDGEGRIVYHAPPPELVVPLITDLLQWVKDSDYPMIIKSCVFHYQFEYIHPFEDGNGRMGRIWQTILLSRYNESFRWIPVESIIRMYQSDYYDAIEYSNSESECTVFLGFMTDAILKALKESVESQLRESTAIDEDMTFNELTLYSIIRDGHFKNIDQAAKLMGVSVPTVNRCLKSLKDHGTIKKIGNKKTGKWIIVTNELVIDKTDVER